MLKRHLCVPPSVQLLDADDQPVKMLQDGSLVDVPAVSFERFLKLCLFADPRWTENYEAICSRSDILAAVRTAQGGVAVLDEDDWKRLDAVVAAPSYTQGPQRVAGFGGWMPEYIPQFKPFLDAIRHASNKAE